MIDYSDRQFDASPGPCYIEAARGLRPRVLRAVRRPLVVGDVRRPCVEDLSRQPADHGAGRLRPADQAGIRVRHRHDDLARRRRLRARGDHRGAARRLDGRLQAGRGVSRTVRVFRALFARFRIHSAADPVGRHRRIAEAARDLHRLGIPGHPDGRGNRRRHAARSGRGRLYAWSERPRYHPPGAAALLRARDRRDPAAGAGLGLDLRHRRRADRIVLRHRSHDHRQPGTAQHRPNHLRHHRDRTDRPDLGLPVQGVQRLAVSWKLA